MNGGLPGIFTELSNKMLRHYHQYGESDRCINVIQNEISFYHKKLVKHHLIKTALYSHQLRGNKTSQHSVYRIVESNYLKVALHVAGEGLKIPLHSHPDSLSSLLVLKGSLAVKQYSFSGMKLAIQEHSLTAGSCSAGLQKKFNTHKLQATASVNAFLSIRCKVPKSTKKQFCKKKLLAMGVGLLTSYGAYALPQFTKSSIKLPNQSMLDTNTGNTKGIVRYAHSLRKKGEEHQYDAARLYHLAANRKDPEAQYWLGYMNLTGMGITEDDDEALKWIAAAADQGYAPANALLNHILTTSGEDDC